MRFIFKEFSDPYKDKRRWMDEWGLADDTSSTADWYRWKMRGDITAKPGRKLTRAMLKATIPSSGPEIVNDWKPKLPQNNVDPGTKMTWTQGWGGGGLNSTIGGEFTVPNITGLNTSSAPSIGSGAKSFTYALDFSQTVGTTNLPAHAYVEAAVEFAVSQPAPNIHSPITAYPTIHANTVRS